MALTRTITAALAISGGCVVHAFSTGKIASSSSRTRIQQTSSSLFSTTENTASASAAGSIHGENSCFLPLLQNDDEYIAPRIVQIAGPYPGVDTETYLSVSSDPAATRGGWSYDFSDPDGPQMGTVALPGMSSVYATEDPVALIADHFEMGVLLPNELVDPVDLIVLCDRSKKTWAERRFLVFETADNPGTLRIAAFETKEELPAGINIVGHVTLVQIPWLPSMQKKKSGFLEEDQLYS